ncbi:MAG TPA: hypothetical protein H9778_10405 [Candidatus Parabacteroides intestinavium]|nr:hypothetical protein [Candidatus Parabacteroides intestinavium]
MNKKVLTLCAGFLLAGSLNTVSAQTWAEDVSKASAPAFWETVDKVTDGRAYQLSDGRHVLVMEKFRTGEGVTNYRLKLVPYYQADLGESLWFVEQVKSNNENGVAFKFVNLAYNLPLSFDPAKAQDYLKGNFTGSLLGGNAAAWSWMRSESGSNLAIARTPEAYITTDSVMTMIPLADGSVAAVKYATKDVQSKVSDLRIKPVVAGPVWLNRHDLNSMLQTNDELRDKFELTFEQGTTSANLWDETPYRAVNPVGKNTLSYGEYNDAVAQRDEAKAAWNKAQERKVAATDAFYTQNEIVGNFYKEKNKVEQAIVDNQANLVEAKSEYSWSIFEVIPAHNQHIQSLTEQINSYSDISDEDKEKIENLQKDYAGKNALYMHYAQMMEDLFIEIGEAEQKIKELNTEADKQNAIKEEKRFIRSMITDKDVQSAMSTMWNGTTSNSVDAFITWFENDANAASMDVLFAGYTDEDVQKLIDFLKELSAANHGSETISFDGGATSNIAITTLYNEITEAKNAETAANAEIKAQTDLITEKDAEAQDAGNKANEFLNEAHQIYYQIKEAQKVQTSHSADLAELQKQREYWEGELAKAEAVKDENLAKVVDLTNKNLELYGQLEDINVSIADSEVANTRAYYAMLRARSYEAWTFNIYDNWYRFCNKLEKEKTPHWLSLQAEDGRYLMVDTAYVTDNAGDQNLAFALAKHDKDFEDAANPMNARDINGRFNFRFLYYPTQDSLRIEADGFNRKNVTTKWWADRTDSEISWRSSYVPGYERNLVKVDVLGNQRDVTIGNSENLKGTNLYTINDRIGFNITYKAPQYAESGLYYMDVEASKDSQRNNARLMVDLDGDLTLIAPADTAKMAFAHMPAAKWVVDTKPTEFGGIPNIYNQETGNRLNNGNYTVTTNEAGETVIRVSFNYQGANILENYTLTPAPSTTLGYYAVEPDVRELFTLNYLNVGGNLNVTVGDNTIANDTVLAVTNGDAVKFELNRVAIEKYGLPYGTDTLKRGIYTINVNDPNKLALKNKFVQVSNVGGTEMMVVAEPQTASLFYLKEVNDANDAHYYALIEVDQQVKLVDGKYVDVYVQGDKKAGVVDATGLIKAEDITAETRTSAFALIADTTRYYREFTAEELGENYNMKFYRTSSTEKEYLYAGAAEKGMTFLAVEGKGDNAGTAAELTVIPTTEEGVLMPQYFIARNVTEKAGSVDWCGEEHEALADSLACPHTTVIPDTLVGEFLVNLKIDDKLNENNLWENKYTRLAFLKGFAVKPEGTMPGEGQYTTLIIGEDTVAFDENKHNPAKFEFRLINDDPAQNFLIESESWKNNDAFAGGERPMVKGGWLKVQNGVPVIVADDFEYASQADVYNVDTNYVPTANEEISANTAVSVVATDGAVIVKGAEGKNVVVSTILGKVVANEVLNSDNETIAAPAGIVVVSVDGESFKVAVK